MRIALSAALILSAYGARPLAAQDSSATHDIPLLIGAQLTVIGQSLGRFHSPYAGANSLVATGDAAVSHTYGLYLGQRIGQRLQLYLDFEMARGGGIGRVVGLGGPTNGDVIRQGSADLGSGPYIARAFARYLIPLGPERDTLTRGQDEVRAVVAGTRLEITVGKVALSDLFDLNRYANSTRQQFMAWGLFQNTAWDFAADTRGYSNGVAIGWVHPNWTLRLGSFQMPTKANGNVFDGRILEDRGDNVELTLSPGPTLPVVRLLAFLNHARMGRYAVANATALANDTTPDIVADDAPGRRKYGFGLNAEIPLADSGETGAFARAGWNDGATESFAFAEVETHLSGGVQVSGAHWHRTLDRLGLALLRHGLSDAHRAYLALGGKGFLLGDGALTYGPEELIEAYYRLQIGRYGQIGPDVQHIWQPGYNRDRGPATVASLRVSLRY